MQFLKVRKQYFTEGCVFSFFCMGLAIIVILAMQLNYLVPYSKYVPLRPPQIWKGTQQPNPRKEKLILYWSRLWKNFAGFNLSLCPFQNCAQTFDKSDLLQSDAVVFSGFNIVKNHVVPSIKPKNQVWIYQNVESQTRSRLSRHVLDSFNCQINYTMTFRPDSDIFSGYGIFKRKNPIKNQSDGTYEVKYPPGRKKLVAWIVSNCSPPSKREVYFTELAKYIQADVFGRCSPNDTCERNCLDYISKNYKFYYAAENSLCRDYVTEKAFKNAYAYNMVPIVYGGANYSLFLPPNSYINVRDFCSPKQLADYLQKLDSNETLYNEYFKWKDELDLFLIDTIRGCNLCGMLNRKIMPTKVYCHLQKFSAQDYFKSIMQ